MDLDWKSGSATVFSTWSFLQLAGIVPNKGTKLGRREEERGVDELMSQGVNGGVHIGGEGWWPPA
jgi:hypothetical protein